MRETFPRRDKNEGERDGRREGEADEPRCSAHSVTNLGGDRGRSSQGIPISRPSPEGAGWEAQGILSPPTRELREGFLHSEEAKVKFGPGFCVLSPGRERNQGDSRSQRQEGEGKARIRREK